MYFLRCSHLIPWLLVPSYSDDSKVHVFCLEPLPWSPDWCSQLLSWHWHVCLRISNFPYLKQTSQSHLPFPRIPRSPSVVSIARHQKSHSVIPPHCTHKGQIVFKRKVTTCLFVIGRVPKFWKRMTGGILKKQSVKCVTEKHNQEEVTVITKKAKIYLPYQRDIGQE